jgi:hypothetical protein
MYSRSVCRVREGLLACGLVFLDFPLLKVNQGLPAGKRFVSNVQASMTGIGPTTTTKVNLGE